MKRNACSITRQRAEQQGLAHDLSVALRYETAMRPEALRWQEWSDHQNEKIARGLKALETKCAQFETSPLIGEITIACALGYRDFRYADDDWRAGRPALKMKQP